ncbi:transposase family protein [Streptomyces sp. NPDC046859]
MHLRHDATHEVPACWFGVDRSTVTRAIGGGATAARRARTHRHPWP